MPNRFRTDNTEGYDEGELAELNAAWHEIVAAAETCDSPPIDAETHGDYWAETLLYQFDSGKRGPDLVGWFYQTGGV